jgi:hypothetical protein
MRLDKLDQSASDVLTSGMCRMRCRSASVSYSCAGKLMIRNIEHANAKKIEQSICCAELGLRLTTLG